VKPEDLGQDRKLRGKRDVRPSFSLTTYFLGTGILTAVVVALALSAKAANDVRAELLQTSQDEAIRVARHVNRQVHQRFIYPTLSEQGSVDLEDPAQLARLDAVVRLSIAELDVRSVYFFDLEGRITYSTHPEHRGFRVQDNHNYEVASGGKPSSVLVGRGNPLDVEGRTEDVSLLETYVPVTPLDPSGKPSGEQVGVMEIYQDATKLVSETGVAMRSAAWNSTLAIGFLMLTLWLWIRKADHTIAQRSQDLLEANAQLAALSEDLEQQVEDRTRRLVRAETLASVGTLAAGVAHEVNNPIAAIASSAEGLLRRANSETLRAHDEFSDFPDYLEIIRDEAFRVKSITRNLLDFSRAENDASTRAPVDLGSLITAAIQLLDYQAQRDGKELVFNPPPSPIVISADSARLRQAVMNLTVNALAAASEGTIRWTLARDGGTVVLACEDQGPGFEPEDLDRALEPFYTRKPAGVGTGLGLSIAHKVVADHGGEILLSNRELGGARVEIRLPVTLDPETLDKGEQA